MTDHCPPDCGHDPHRSVSPSLPDRTEAGESRPCPACGVLLRPDETHWSLGPEPMGGYVCPEVPSTGQPDPDRRGHIPGCRMPDCEGECWEDALVPSTGQPDPDPADVLAEVFDPEYGFPGVDWNEWSHPVEDGGRYRRKALKRMSEFILRDLRERGYEMRAAGSLSAGPLDVLRDLFTAMQAEPVVHGTDRFHHDRWMRWNKERLMPAWNAAARLLSDADRLGSGATSDGEHGD